MILEAVTEIREMTEDFAFRAMTKNFTVSIAVNEESEKCFSVVILKLLTVMREKLVRCFDIMILKQIKMIEKFAVLIS